MIPITQLNRALRRRPWSLDLKEKNMKKYNYAVVGCGKDHKDIKRFYHFNDILDKFDRVSFVKNVRHAGVMSLYNSAFYTCKCLQKEAVEDIQKAFSVDNLTKEYYYYRCKTGNDNKNLIGISIGSFCLSINYQRIYCGVHLSFQLLNNKPQFVISYTTNSKCLHLSEETSIESEDIDEFVSKIKERTSELIGELKELVEEYDAFLPKTLKSKEEVIKEYNKKKASERKDRQREGIDAAKKRGVHMGRPAAVEPDNFLETYMKWKAGRITAKEAMRITNLSSSVFYRLAKKRANATNELARL